MDHLSLQPAAVPEARGILIFSGGSAANNLCDVFGNVAETDKGGRLTYVIPISDNGGSSSELIRVLGGPGIGDLRSRLVRLIPDSPELHAIKVLFNFRLSPDHATARLEWLDIVEGRHDLWRDIPGSKAILLRSFLIETNTQILKRMRPSSAFAFEHASIGNLFLSGARIFTGSLESAIYLLSTVCAIPANVSVVPAINSNFSHHICAELADGTTITGQNAISHPSAPSVMQPPEINGVAADPFSEAEIADSIEDANLPGSLPSLRKQYIKFSKTEGFDDLPARISRLFYINPYGQEIRPPANPQTLEALRSASAIIYSIGSLFTSIVPCLVLRGVGEAIRNSSARHKILILNGSLDRETGPRSHPFTATDFAVAIARASLESTSARRVENINLASYVTHIIHLEGQDTPTVDRTLLSSLGIETIRVYGRKNLYDAAALEQALTALVGKTQGRADRSRRSTMESALKIK